MTSQAEEASELRGTDVVLMLLIAAGLVLTLVLQAAPQPELVLEAVTDRLGDVAGVLKTVLLLGLGLLSELTW